MMLDHFTFHHIDDVLGDIGGVVADAFQMARDEKQRHRPGSRADVLGHVIVDQLILDEIAQFVRFRVRAHDLLGQGNVAFHECVDGVPYHVLRHHGATNQAIALYN